MLKDLYRNRYTVFNLAVNDFSTKYAGSSLGVIWGFIQPLITLFVYWIVFEFGLKAAPPVENVTYIVWFAAGMIPWLFFSESLVAETNCLIEYSYLVKKMMFNVELLPFIKLFSSLIVHGVFVVILIAIALITGQDMNIAVIQIFYYTFCVTVLVYGLGKLTSAVVVFFKDLTQIVNIVLQIGMWATPIIWSFSIVPQRFQWILKLNPLLYVVEGYRDSFINHTFFWEKPLLTLYFWGFTLVVVVLGNVVTKKLKTHFADVL